MSAFPPFVSYLFRSGTIRVLPRIHYQYKQFRTSDYRRWVTWSVDDLVRDIRHTTLIARDQRLSGTED